MRHREYCHNTILQQPQLREGRAIFLKLKQMREPVAELSVHVRSTGLTKSQAETTKKWWFLNTDVLLPLPCPDGSTQASTPQTRH
jgi:hypothetical protein